MKFKRSILAVLTIIINIFSSTNLDAQRRIVEGKAFNQHLDRRFLNHKPAHKLNLELTMEPATTRVIPAKMNGEQPTLLYSENCQLNMV